MDSINEGVIRKLAARAERGHAKYGVTMDRGDLTEREWLEHAQAELLDGAVYLEKLIRLNGSCKWGLHNTGCGELRIELDDPDRVLCFCPFCGRKIEEEVCR